MARKILVADLLCGAGGSSTGCQRALAELGLEMELVCLNHWPTAIETHTLNHPEARHYCQDISTVRPHMVVPEGYLDLLMASPTCTHHSVARGGKPTSDQQRSDPWHIVTWLTELRVKRMIIENVWEFRDWGPVDPRTGKPIKSRKGEYFKAWITVIRGLGFEPEWRKLNAADYGDATTRQRFILMARSDGRSVSWPAATHMKRPNDGLAVFPTMKTWRPAREIIDWSIRGSSVFKRPIPLAPKTLLRIGAGALKFDWPPAFIALLEPEMIRSLMHVIRFNFARRNAGKVKDRQQRRQRARQAIHWLRRVRGGEPIFGPGGRENVSRADPMLVTLRRGADGKSTAEPLPTITANAQHIGLAEPVIMNGRKGSKAGGVDETPLPTLDTKGGVWLAEPMILSQHSSGAARPASEPLPTITTGGAGTEERPGCARPMLVEPFVLGRNGAEGGKAERRARSVEAPMPSATVRGAGYIVEPFIATIAHGNDAHERDPNSRRTRSLDDPLQTIHGDGSQYAVIEPFVLSQASGGAPRSTDEPVPAIPTDGAHALISPYYGSGSGETCSSAEEPLPTVTTKGRLGMVVPITHSDGSNRARDVDQPLPTLTTANRGELAFITTAFGEREGQSPRVHAIAEPTPTICASGSVNLVEGTQELDILFRMLEPPELAAAMGFSGDDLRYEFVGTKTDQIKQIGNAVSVRKMKACVGAIMADAAPKKRAEPAEQSEREVA